MKTAKTGAVSGCTVWVLAFSVLCSCLFPVTMIVGGITSTVMGESVARILGPHLCPENTTARIYTYATTTFDESGFETPSTAYEMRCVDPNGNVIKNFGATYAFIWVGVLGGIGLALASLLAFFLAAPMGTLIGRWARRKQNPSLS